MAKPPNEVKDRVHTEDTDISDKVMIRFTIITSTSNTLKNWSVNIFFHYFYIKKEYNGKKETIINIFSEYVEPLLKGINHPALIQERKRNLDAEEYKRNIDANLYKPPKINEFNCHGRVMSNFQHH